MHMKNFRLAKEEFEIRKKLLQINKGINVGTHDPLTAVKENTLKRKKIPKRIQSAVPRAEPKKNLNKSGLLK